MRALGSALVLLVALPALGCSGDDTQLQQASLNIAARDMTGREGQVGCLVLPLLQGSRSYQRYVIDDLITVLVMAEPGQANVQFQRDGKQVEERTIPRSALLRPYDEDVLVPLSTDLPGFTSDHYTVTLSAECAP